MKASDSLATFGEPGGPNRLYRRLLAPIDHSRDQHPAQCYSPMRSPQRMTTVQTLKVVLAAGSTSQHWATAPKVSWWT